MKIKFCRNCKSDKLVDLLSLGKMSFTGKFPKNNKINIPKANLNLLIYKFCKFVQLDQNFSQKYLYGSGYGYRTGINKTMTEHVKKIVKKSTAIVKLKKNDHVLDIASNDGTLLNFYNSDIIKVGIDPLINKYKKFYKKIQYPISNFFNFKDIHKKKLSKKFKIITALSVFYDLKKPNSFFKDIKKILSKDGIFVLEQADLLLTLQRNIFDTICHEHLGFYSSKVIIDMVKNNNLKVFNHEYNNINGGSSRYYICHEDSKFNFNKKNIYNTLKKEKNYNLYSVKTFKSFYANINKQKKILNKLIKKIKNKNMSIHGYGASTKGNVLLQFYNINNKQIDYISDRNPLKSNFYTPGTKIKIISENKSRKIKPDYYLVLPWHFKKEILHREKKIRSKGVKFIFPLPNLRIE